MLLIGAGVGITPLRALAEGLAYAPGDAVLLHRCTDRAAVRRRAAGLARGARARVIGLPGPRRAPDSWLGDGVGHDDLAALLRWVPDLAERDVFLCGPDAWTAGVARLLVAAGVPTEHLHPESFGW